MLIYNATVSAYYVEDGVEELNDKVFDATLTYNKTSGDFELSANAGLEGDTVYFGLTGNYKVDSKSIVFALDSVTADDVAVNFDFKIVVKAKAEMPEFPTDVIDVVDLTTEQIQEIEYEVENGPLGQLIERIEAENNYDSGYDY